MDIWERVKIDPEFAQLVDMMEAFMHRCEFTPSEMRQAAIMASIQFEQHRLYRHTIVPQTKELEQALQVMHEYNGEHDDWRKKTATELAKDRAKEEMAATMATANLREPKE